MRTTRAPIETLTAVFLCSLLAAAGCQTTSDQTCLAQCGIGCGSSDGCGGLCGCEAGTSCNGHGQCVASEVCEADCLDLGRSCGEVCGQSCGECATGELCIDGGCEGARDEACIECSLGLSVVGQRQVGSGQTEVVLAIDYRPAEGETRPRLADIRLISDRDLSVGAVEAGPGLLEAGKELFRSPVLGTDYRQRADGSIQFFAVSLNNTERFVPGRLLTVTVQFAGEGASIRLLRREQIFAPIPADHALQASAYDTPVVVVR